MSEASLGGAFLARLRREGWLAWKLNDASRRGLPDAVAARGGYTWFLEFKLWPKPVQEIVWHKILRKKDEAQLATMLEAERHSMALYIVFCGQRGTFQKPYGFKPSDVEYSYKREWPCYRHFDIRTTVGKPLLLLPMPDWRKDVHVR